MIYKVYKATFSLRENCKIIVYNDNKIPRSFSLLKSGGESVKSSQTKKTKIAAECFYYVQYSRKFHYTEILCYKSFKNLPYG
jgi:hypothetical protein